MVGLHSAVRLGEFDDQSVQLALPPSMARGGRLDKRPQCCHLAAPSEVEAHSQTVLVFETGVLPTHKFEKYRKKTEVANEQRGVSTTQTLQRYKEWVSALESKQLHRIVDICRGIHIGNAVKQGEGEG